MRPWTIILPVFVVRWYVRRNGERFLARNFHRNIHRGYLMSEGPPGCWFMVDP